MSQRRKKRIEPPKNIAVIYARFSSTNQREESIDAQVRACNKYAQDNSFAVLRVYADHALSGTNDNRPQFQQMLADSSKGEFDTVIIHKLDRFSRNRFDSAINKGVLKSNGCRIVSVIENLGDSPEDALMEAIMEGFNEFYSKNLAREVLKGQKETALQCKHNGGTPPLGYDVDKSTQKYVINEEEAKVVRLIFDMYSKGKGYKEILSYLNAMNYRTKRGRHFGNGSLNNLLKNEKYRGVYTFNRKKEKDFDGVRRPTLKDEEEIIRIEGGMPRIVDDVTFAKVQSLLLRNLQRGGSFKAKEIYLLSGLIYCGGCGMSMCGNARYCGRNKLRYVTYRCSGRAQKRGCKTKEINKIYLENFVLDILYKNLFNEYSISKLTKMVNEYKSDLKIRNEETLKNANLRIKEIDKEIGKILDLVSSAGIDISTVSEKLKSLEEQKKYLENHIEELSVSMSVQMNEDMVYSLIEKSKQFIRSKNLPECKTFIESYIERVDVFSDKVKVVFKIKLPSENGETLESLVVEETMENIYSVYKEAV